MKRPIALVTGVNRGIGLEVSRRFLTGSAVIRTILEHLDLNCANAGRTED